MNTNRLIYLIILSSLLIGACTTIFLLMGESGYSILNILILILILVFGGLYIFKEMKKNAERSEGLPKENELSNLIKYKSGYRAYMATMYMWLIIFLFKDKFPDIETLLGGGILLSGLIFMLIRASEKKKFFE